MSENSQDYAQKPQRNCMFMNSAASYKCSISAGPKIFFTQRKPGDFFKPADMLAYLVTVLK